MVLKRDCSITWYGHSTFKVVSPKGVHILIDPWVMGNPVCPDSLKKVDRIDLMLITHGHFDHMADATALAKTHNPKVVAIFEIAAFLQSRGVENTLPMNMGGTQQVNGIKVTMVQAFHSSGIQDEEGRLIYGGDPAGYVVTLENGFTFYHAGDTQVFGDMRLIADLYHPQLCFLPIGDLFTMSPKEAAYACRLLKPRWVIPMHYGTFPPLTGTPGKLKQLTKAVRGLKVVDMKPGDTIK
ncbi:MAG: metal-dependent hydrolase [candidate division NC10 bacterium]